MQVFSISAMNPILTNYVCETTLYIQFPLRFWFLVAMEVLEILCQFM